MQARTGNGRLVVLVLMGLMGLVGLVGVQAQVQVRVYSEARRVGVK